MTSVKLVVLFAVCATIVAVQSRSLEQRSKRSPEDWTDSVKGAFNKAKDNVADGLSTVKDKISEIGQNIKNSDAYEKLSSEIHDAGEVLSKVGEKIKEKSKDTYEGVKEGINKATDSFKDKTQSAYEGVKDGVSDASDTIKEKGQGVMDGVSDGVSGASDSIQKKIQDA